MEVQNFNAFPQVERGKRGHHFNNEQDESGKVESERRKHKPHQEKEHENCDFSKLKDKISQFSGDEASESKNFMHKFRDDNNSSQRADFFHKHSKHKNSENGGIVI